MDEGRPLSSAVQSSYTTVGQSKQVYKEQAGGTEGVWGGGRGGGWGEGWREGGSVGGRGGWGEGGWEGVKEGGREEMRFNLQLLDPEQRTCTHVHSQISISLIP